MDVARARRRRDGSDEDDVDARSLQHLAMDIEMTRIKGVHGPRTLDVVLVAE